MSTRMEQVLESLVSGNSEDGFQLQPEEADKLKTSMADPQFRTLLNEYMAEISDPKYRQEQEMYINQLEAEQKVPQGKKLIRPQPGFVAKTRFAPAAEPQDARKLFVNVVQIADIGAPERAAAQEGDKGGVQLSLPHAAGPPRMEQDKSGAAAATVDVCFHPEAVALALARDDVKDLMVASALASAEAQLASSYGYAVAVERSYRVVKGLAHRGGTPPSMLYKVKDVQPPAVKAPVAAPKASVPSSAAAASSKAAQPATSTSTSTAARVPPKQPAVKKGFLNSAPKSKPKPQARAAPAAAPSAAAAAAAAPEVQQGAASPAVPTAAAAAAAAAAPAAASAAALDRAAAAAAAVLSKSSGSAAAPSGAAPLGNGGDASAALSNSAGAAAAAAAGFAVGGAEGGGGGAGAGQEGAGSGAMRTVEPLMQERATNGVAARAATAAVAYTLTERGEFELSNHTMSRDMPSRRPRELVLRITIPAGVKPSALELDVGQRAVRLNNGKTGKLLLDLRLPYPVLENEGSAKVDKARNLLTVTMPVVPPPPPPPTPPPSLSTAAGNAAEAAAAHEALPPEAPLATAPEVQLQLSDGGDGSGNSAQRKERAADDPAPPDHSRWLQAAAPGEKFKFEVPPAAAAAAAAPPGAAAAAALGPAAPAAAGTAVGSSNLDLPTAGALSDGAAESGPFIASPAWRGAKPGYAFRRGKHGQGYYVDAHQQAPGVAPAAAVAAQVPAAAAPAAAAESEATGTAVAAAGAVAAEAAAAAAPEAAPAARPPFDFRENELTASIILQVPDVDADTFEARWTARRGDITARTGGSSGGGGGAVRLSLRLRGDIDPARSRHDVATKNVAIVLYKARPGYWGGLEDEGAAAAAAAAADGAAAAAARAAQSQEAPAGAAAVAAAVPAIAGHQDGVPKVPAAAAQPTAADAAEAAAQLAAAELAAAEPDVSAVPLSDVPFQSPLVFELD